MITVNEQASEARKVRRLADQISRLAKQIESREMTNERRHAIWAEIRANAVVVQKRGEHARDGD
jgi:hypothetical protein